MALDLQQLRSFISRRSRLGRLWRWGRTPKTIPIVLRAPAALSNIDALLALYPAVTRAQAAACRMELLRNGRFFEELNRPLVEKRHRRTTCEGWHEFLYMVVRFAKPKVVFETGVFDGLSSAVILLALHDNTGGSLVSIDLPAKAPIKGSTDRMIDATLPADTPPGWIVPAYLRQRYRLVLGDSRELLPELLREYSSIDIFFHDSLHTFDHQYFEYTTVWPHLIEGGLLLSDDIFWNAAFYRFSKERGKRYLHIDGFGAIRK
jgi:predicted O-methyltransferase YrrM